jgi:citrate lyase beta subunit
LPYKQRIVLIRFGAEDMLKALGLRRTCHDSLFDFAATRNVLGHLIGTFKSAGFALSGGVYPCFKEHEGFSKEVQRDLKEGLFSKTLIHPDQIVSCHELYKVEEREFDEALEILLSKDVLFAQNGKMAEVHTMSRWAKEIVFRAQIYGMC